MESICKRICKVKGHAIAAIDLHTTQRMKDGMPFHATNNIVICTVCGASLAQIRG
jgi:hypothetical protein